jgi:hypothetical protein
MARLLARASEDALRPETDKDRPQPADEAIARSMADEMPAKTAQAAPAAVAFERTVHEAAPEPEPEEQQPATLEALAARFSHRNDKAAVRPDKPNRSRQEREKQAAILARLRGESGQ